MGSARGLAARDRRRAVRARARVDLASVGRMLRAMSLTEIKTAIEGLTDEERIFLAAYLRRKIDEDSPARREEMASIRDEMAAGRRFSMTQLRQRHDEMAAEGL